MALFKRSDSSNMNMRFSQLGRRGMVIIAAVVIVGLIVGAFVYGNQARNSEQAQSSTRSSKPQQLPGDARSRESSRQTTSDRDSNNRSSSAPNNRRPSTPQTSQTSSVVNTGPEDYAPFIAAGLAILGWYYRDSLRKLNHARSNA